MAKAGPIMILTFMSEMVLDVDESSVCNLMDIQHLYIRQFLGVGSRSMLATLFSEMGFLLLMFAEFT